MLATISMNTLCNRMSVKSFIRRLISVAPIVMLLTSPASLRATELPVSFFQSYCTSCHAGEDAANGIALDNLNHLSIASRVSHEDSELLQRALTAIRAGKMPPANADQPDDTVRESAVTQLHSALLEKSGFGGTLLRRLSRSEYTSSIESLFGFSYQLPNSFPEDRVEHGFDNSAEGLVVSAPLMESYFHSAINIADRVIPPAAKPPGVTKTQMGARDLVISYSSGAVIDGTMRLAFDWNVLFRSTTWPEKWEARHPGTYRITVNASQLLSQNAAYGVFEGPMKLEIRARSLNGKDSEPVRTQRLLTTFDVTTDEPQEFEFIAELYPQETPVFYFSNGPVPGEKKPLEQLTLKMFQADARLYAGWKAAPQTNGGRGGLGWSRVKAIRDSEDLDLSQLDTSAQALARLAKTLANNPGNYGETMVFQFYEEGPALELHSVTIEGPLSTVQTPAQKAQVKRTKDFLGKLADPGIRNQSEFKEILSTFYQQYLTRLFRRPATRQDIAYYTSITLGEINESGDTLKGIHLGLRTSLMSPKFLYRGHSPGELDAYDLATRLAFFLTNAPPDEALMRAVNNGEIKRPNVLTAQARRLLNAPTALSFTSQFTNQWLGITDLRDIMPDTRLIDQFNDSDYNAMTEETHRFFQHILRNNLSMETFIQPQFTFANERLATQIYRLKGVKGKFAKVDLPEDSPYGGLLGQASIMMATANGVDTLPVTRGVWVLENILGDTPPPPPENVPAITPDTSNARTIREVLAAHRADTACASCHRSIDPIGFVLENFDPVGRWREHYPVLADDASGKPVHEQGLAINTQGIYKDGTEFQNVQDLKQYVVDNIDMFSLCLSGKLLEYATGRPPTYAEKVELQQLIQANRDASNGFQDLLLGIINTRAFRTK